MTNRTSICLSIAAPLVILGVPLLAAWGFLAYVAQCNRQVDEKATQAIASGQRIIDAIEQHGAANGRLPTSLGELQIDAHLQRTWTLSAGNQHYVLETMVSAGIVDQPICYYSQSDEWIKGS
ncbi:MAG: hypothetical protein AAF561_08725 [Planctomycetota bacterium]